MTRTKKSFAAAVAALALGASVFATSDAEARPRYRGAAIGAGIVGALAVGALAAAATAPAAAVGPSPGRRATGTGRSGPRRRAPSRSRSCPSPGDNPTSRPAADRMAGGREARESCRNRDRRNPWALAVAA